MGTNRVFISYRRDDAEGYAGRLEEALEERLGRGSVFRDVLDIAPGADFVEAIRQRLAGAQTVLVLIGPRWAGGDSPGTRRIDDAQDFVRLEVQVALASSARIIPLLLPGMRMPAETELPDPLKPLATQRVQPERCQLGRRHSPAGGQHRQCAAPRALAAAGRRRVAGCVGARRGLEAAGPWRHAAADGGVRARCGGHQRTPGRRLARPGALSLG